MTSTEPTARPRQGGPPMGVLALVSALLFLLGLFVAAALANGFPPAPTASAHAIQSYFHGHRGAARIAALFQFGAAVPLAIYAATASARLHNLGVRAPGATIALAGGLLSAGFLAVSALIEWVLSRSEVVGDPTLVRALQDFGFVTGGPGHVVFLGLLVAGIAVPALFVQLLPRWFALAGLAFAVVAELSTFSLASDALVILLPIARFPLLLWLVVAGFRLPQSRPRRAPAGAVARAAQSA